MTDTTRGATTTRSSIHLQAGLVLLAGAAAAALFGGGRDASPATDAAEPALVRRAAAVPAPLPPPTTQLLGYVDDAAGSVGAVQTGGLQTWGRAAETQPRTAGRVDAAVWQNESSRRNETTSAATLAAPLFTAAAGPPPRATMKPFAPPTEPRDGMTPVIPGTSRKHVVRDGDTLGGLAEKYYGDARRYRELFAANRHLLSSPDLLPIGATLDVPSFDPTLQPATPPATGARLLPQVLPRTP